VVHEGVLKGTGSMLRGIAAFGLPGHVSALTDVPPGPRDWAALMSEVRGQRLVGHLQAAVDAGALPVSDEQRVEVQDLHLGACGVVLGLEQRLLELVDLLEGAGIDVVVLKGSATAHLVYPDPGVRMFGDNDLLFRPEQFDEALEVLFDAGYERPAAPPRPGFDRRFGKGATLRGRDGDELDAHKNLLFGTFGFRIDLDELFDSAVDFEVGGRRLRGLGPETRLMHACYHSALGDPDPRYSSVRDVAQMLVSGAHDVRRVLELARRWEAQPVLARAFALCRSHLGVVVDSPLVAILSEYEPTRRERRAVDSYVGNNRHFAAKVLASLSYLDSHADRLAFVLASVAPSDAFIETRGGEPGFKWIARGVRSLLRGDVG
jgi:hypothetical protein